MLWFVRLGVVLEKNNESYEENNFGSTKIEFTDNGKDNYPQKINRINTAVSEAINTASNSTEYCVLPNNIPHLHDDTKLKGRRLVDIGNIFSSIQSINGHAPFGCSFSDMEATKEARQDLASTIYFKCKNCNTEKKIQTESYAEEETCMNFNTATAAVSVSMAIGVEFSQLGEFFAALDVPFMCKSTWNTRQEQIVNDKRFFAVCSYNYCRN
ncbi:hypothetical protein PR048_019547 [Dryococelus australis]|uniref:Mutator-like transposase domain-containing protein n=1 Tax=Dryococelus australis TaxID=614101 RepID=A0ABQ9H3R3_9NEOP|nr:hypothetical protein PR048_019547 [Dryococelus australis]